MTMVTACPDFLAPESLIDAFDDGLGALVAPWAVDGTVEINLISHITWGFPRGDRPC